MRLNSQKSFDGGCSIEVTAVSLCFWEHVSFMWWIKMVAQTIISTPLISCRALGCVALFPSASTCRQHVLMRAQQSVKVAPCNCDSSATASRSLLPPPTSPDSHELWKQLGMLRFAFLSCFYLGFVLCPSSPHPPLAPQFNEAAMLNPTHLP